MDYMPLIMIGIIGFIAGSIAQLVNNGRGDLVDHLARRHLVLDVVDAVVKFPPAAASLQARHVLIH